MPFISAGDGDLKSAFITDAWLIDQFVGNRLWVWGRNEMGQLGDNTVTNKSSPTQTITFGSNWSVVSGGNRHTAAIKTDGTLWAWGRNNSGQLGNAVSIHNQSSPVQTIALGSNWSSVACGVFSTAAIKTDGTLWVWGNNSNGELGDNTVVNKSSPIQTITRDINWKQVSCGNQYAAAIKTDGTLWTWGLNTSGQLGDNTTISRSSPVQVVGFATNWKSVSCGSKFTAAIKTDGTLWLWGSNANGYGIPTGQLGDNSGTNRSSPVQTVTFATNWKFVACGNYHTAEIKTDGTLWCWGFNSYYGQLGDNTLTNRSSPVQTVAATTNWKQVACGYGHTAAIKTDGTLWSWGRNESGQLGDGSITNKSSPVQTSLVGTNWKQISCGYGSIFSVTYGD